MNYVISGYSVLHLIIATSNWLKNYVIIFLIMLMLLFSDKHKIITQLSLSLFDYNHRSPVTITKGG